MLSERQCSHIYSCNMERRKYESYFDNKNPVRTKSHVPREVAWNELQRCPNVTTNRKPHRYIHTHTCRFFFAVASSIMPPPHLPPTASREPVVLKLWKHHFGCMLVIHSSLIECTDNVPRNPPSVFISWSFNEARFTACPLTRCQEEAHFFCKQAEKFLF